MKKIVHLIDNLVIGGAQTHLLTILKCADREKYSHVVYSLTDELAIGCEIESLGIKVLSLNLQDFLRKKRWVAVARGVSKMIKEEKPDLLETHLTWSRIFGAAASLMTGSKNMISFEQGDIFNTGWQYTTANFLASFFMDLIIVPSAAIRKWVNKNYLIPLHKMRIMHNAVLTDVFKLRPDRQDFRKALGLGKDEIVVGSVGTLGTGINKGMDYCITATAELSKKYSGIRLLIVGDGILKEKLERQARDLGLEKAVKFLGFRRDISSILNAIDIFVLASPFEPCGIALIEAMSMERAVIGSASGGTIELIDNGVDGFLFPPRDSKALAERLERLIMDEKLRKEMGMRARKKVEERFNANRYVLQLESLYADLINRRD